MGYGWQWFPGRLEKGQEGEEREREGGQEEKERSGFREVDGDWGGGGGLSQE
jgi:hypothetical protein